MNRSKSLAIIPLIDGSVLLPGSIVRVPINGRVDIPEIFTGGLKSSASASDPQQVAIGLVPLKNAVTELESDGVLSQGIEPEDIYEYGTLGKLRGVEGKGSGQWALLIEGVVRIQIRKITQVEPFIQADVTYLEDSIYATHTPQTLELIDEVKQRAREAFLGSAMSNGILSRRNGQRRSHTLRQLGQLLSRKSPEQVGQLADFIASLVEDALLDKRKILSATDIDKRLELVLTGLEAQSGFNKGGIVIASIVRSDVALPISKREQPKNPLDILRKSGFSSNQAGSLLGGFGNQGQDGADTNELEELQEKLDAAKMTGEALKVSEREMKRLRKMNPAQAEYQVCRTYLETLASLPWSRVTDDRLGPESLDKARKQFDDDHYGLEAIKKRLLQYLAVLKLKKAINADTDARISQLEQSQSTEDEEIRTLRLQRKSDRPPILLLVGPPGTGKTSLAKSIATALGRNFQRLSLGGVRDEAEIRGHRRTYVAAMPGLIVNGLRKAGSSNPVFLLDELDKLSEANFHGSPSAAMLEVCDPEQNHTFTDHYLSVPIDLSQVLFVATANSLSTIPPPLLDRMEVISLPGYTTLEKRHIASRHLIPKQIAANGLSPDHVTLSPLVIDEIVSSYTRESGVRNLEREIGTVCRHKAVEFIEAKDQAQLENYEAQVTTKDLEAILGPSKFEDEIAGDSSRPGVVTGLVAYSIGGNGSILFIEVAAMPGKGRVQLTGKLGDVLKESVEVALSWVKSHAYDLGLTKDTSTDIMKDRSIHVHCPSGAVPKDGPSAGLAHAIALISLFMDRAVDPRLAMTGEISLRGRITAVGGIKEKLIGALRAGVTRVMLPAQNEKDCKELPDEVRSGLEIIYVSHIWDAMQHVWPQARWPGAERLIGIESRL